MRHFIKGFKSWQTVYEHYRNKEALLTACFLTIDDEIACKIANAPKSLSAGVNDLQSLDDLCWLLWLPYWNCLTADYDRTLFYWHFCNSEYYTPTVVWQRIQNGKAFWGLVQSVNGLSQFSERCNLEMLFWNLVDNTVAMAAKVLRVFIQTMRSMSTPCIIWSFSRCSPCSDKIAAMITKRAANNCRPLHTAEHLTNF